MLVDYHIHTKASMDSVGSIAEYIDEAQKKGINEIGFSDYANLHFEAGHSCWIPSIKEDYVREFFEAKKESKIPIKLGAEMSFFSEDAGKIREFIQKYPFDYVIGSVHYLGEWQFNSPLQVDEYLKKGLMQIYEDYLSSIRDLCESRLFDILGQRV